eukprot:gb/GECH01010252.1/.p1 GENE.gb/GECH01010252.1/~~gb/GECH01010252.1/.p1  ORF type:complete len:383 (+),score=66.74 gb/GECH01010252.1/:1-1149(+)
MELINEKINEDRVILSDIPEYYSFHALKELKNIESSSSFEKYLIELDRCKTNFYSWVFDIKTSECDSIRYSLKSIYLKCQRELESLVFEYYPFPLSDEMKNPSLFYLCNQKRIIDHEEKLYRNLLQIQNPLLKRNVSQSVQDIHLFQRATFIQMKTLENVECLNQTLKKYPDVKQLLKLNLDHVSREEQAEQIQKAAYIAQDIFSQGHSSLQNLLNSYHIIEWSDFEFEIIGQIKDRSEILNELDFIEEEQNYLLPWEKNRIIESIPKFRKKCIRKGNDFKRWKYFKRNLIKEMKFYQKESFDNFSGESTLETIFKKMKDSVPQSFDYNIRKELEIKRIDLAKKNNPLTHNLMKWFQALTCFNYIFEKEKMISREKFFEFLL